MKTEWKPGNLVLPAPAALVSCQAEGGPPNLITVAWCGNINSSPPMLSISVQPSRHSHGILEQSGEFVVNIPSLAQAREVDFCGVVSGRDMDKWAETGLTPMAMAGVSCPGVEECPVNIACNIKHTIKLGSHSLFLAEIVHVSVTSSLIDPNGRFRIEGANILCYAHGFYFGLGDKKGHFGWSVRKKKARRKG